MENILPIGLVRDFPTESRLAEVDKLGLLVRINEAPAPIASTSAPLRSII